MASPRRTPFAFACGSSRLMGQRGVTGLLVPGPTNAPVAPAVDPDAAVAGRGPPGRPDCGEPPDRVVPVLEVVVGDVARKADRRCAVGVAPAVVVVAGAVRPAPVVPGSEHVPEPGRGLVADGGAAVVA